jgi:hypothetical protein
MAWNIIYPLCVGPAEEQVPPGARPEDQGQLPRHRQAEVPQQPPLLPLPGH